MNRDKQNYFTNDPQMERIELVVSDRVSDMAPMRFRNFRLLAEGATGIVYSALCDDDSPVAVKVYKKELVFGTDSAKRFQQEILALKQITHPNIVKIISSGITDDGQSFIVMELVDGASIRTILETDGVFEPERAIKVAGEICRALEALHMKGIIHRDIKPNNIILDSNNIAKIVDFGIAKLMNSSDDTITQYGSIIGTPTYMSPEQCLGQSVDERSDIYSLGCTLFELLTGQKAFDGSTAMETLAKQIDVERSHIDKPLIAAGSPVDLRNVIAKCLQRDPADRYLNVSELSHDLSAILLGSPLIFAKQKSPVRSISAARKNQLAEAVSRLKTNWQVVACCSAVIVAAVIIRANINSLTPDTTHVTAKLPINKPAPYTIYNRKTRQPLFSDVTATNLSDAIVSAVAHHASLQYADLSGEHLFRCKLDGVDLSYADLSNANLSNSSFNKANLHGAILHNTSLQNTSLIGADVSATQLNSAMLRDADASNASFMGSDLSNANLSQGTFRNTNFRNANLRNVRFYGATLEGADLSYSDCAGAEFDNRRSSLAQTKFDGAKNLVLSSRGY